MGSLFVKSNKMQLTKNIFVQKGRNWRNWRNLGLKPLLYKDFIVTLLVTLLDLEV